MLRPVTKILKPVDVVPVAREKFAVIGPKVVKVRYIQNIGTASAAGIDVPTGDDCTR